MFQIFLQVYYSHAVESENPLCQTIIDLHCLKLAGATFSSINEMSSCQTYGVVQ